MEWAGTSYLPSSDAYIFWVPDLRDLISKRLASLYEAAHHPTVWRRPGKIRVAWVALVSDAGRFVDGGDTGLLFLQVVS